MSAEDGPHPSPLHNSLLGMALILAAALNIVLLAGTGWAAWQRATLGQTWQSLRESGPLASAEADGLLELLAAGQSGTATIMAALPTDADVARFVAALRAQAAAAGVVVINLSAEPAPALVLPRRVFLLKLEGEAAQLLALLIWTAQNAPGAARIEAVSLVAEGQPAELSFRLLLAVRPSAP